MLPFEYVDLLAAALQAHPDVRIVVHSSWREMYALDELQDFLGPLGDRLDGVVGPGERAQAITAYATGTCLVLDDDAAAFPAGYPLPVVLCDPRSGLSDPTAQDALRAWLENNR